MRSLITSTPNVADEIGVSVEALDMLGLVEDRDRVTETVTAGFEALNTSGQTGERYVQLSRNLITLSGMITALDGATYPENRSYPKTYVYHELWTPKADQNSYKAEELGKLERGEQNSD
ncbi:MAG: hypothetical protein ACREGF_07125 [Candidatus Saccharimonadales bacterium]